MIVTKNTKMCEMCGEPIFGRAKRARTCKTCYATYHNLCVKYHIDRYHKVYDGLFSEWLIKNKVNPDEEIKINLYRNTITDDAIKFARIREGERRLVKSDDAL